MGERKTLGSGGGSWGETRREHRLVHTVCGTTGLRGCVSGLCCLRACVLCLGFVRFVNVERRRGRVCCRFSELCAISLFVCFFVCVRGCRVIRVFVQVGIHALSLYEPTVHLSLFHRVSFLFFFGAADTIVDRVATE